MNLNDLSTYCQNQIKSFIKWALLQPKLKRKLHYLGLLNHGSLEVTITLVSLKEMEILNNRYLNKKFATDVLSFPAPVIFKEFGHMGDLVICLPVAKKQAKANKHTLKTELKVLITHGLLHLMGMDHEGSTSKAKEMSYWEKQRLGEKLGLIVRTPGMPRPITGQMTR